MSPDTITDTSRYTDRNRLRKLDADITRTEARLKAGGLEWQERRQMQALLTDMKQQQTALVRRLSR